MTAKKHGKQKKTSTSNRALSVRVLLEEVAHLGATTVMNDSRVNCCRVGMF